MCRLEISSDMVNLKTDVKIRQDVFTCLFPALLAAMPAFLDAFFKCINPPDDGAGFKPGDRPRCG